MMRELGTIRERDDPVVYCQMRFELRTIKYMVQDSLLRAREYNVRSYGDE